MNMFSTIKKNSADLWIDSSSEHFEAYFLVASQVYDLSFRHPMMSDGSLSFHTSFSLAAGSLLNFICISAQLSATTQSEYFVHISCAHTGMMHFYTSMVCHCANLNGKIFMMKSSSIVSRKTFVINVNNLNFINLFMQSTCSLHRVPSR